VDRRLLLEPAERRALALDAVAALERLRDRRATSDSYTPSDPELIRALLAPPGTDGTSETDLLERFVEAAAIGWDKTNGGSFAFIPNGALESGVIAALLAAGAHGFTGAAFEAPALVALEEGILRWMASLFRLPGGSGGLLLSGGSLANQTAIVTARAHAGAGRGGATMYVSERAHHSVTKAARLAGLQADAIRIVATDRDGRLDAADLRRAVADDTNHGRRPFLIVGVAGSTDTGSIDPLAELADIAAASGAWLHVDAAYGGFFAMTDRGRSRLAGIERADSITVDAHKGLFLPYGVGAILVRDPAALVEAHEGTGAYLRDVPRIEGLPHYFERGPELTRPFRGAAVWFPLHLHGTGAFARELDRMLDLAEMAHRRLAAVPGIEVGPPPATSIVTFRAAAGDAATERVVAALHASGRFQVSTTSLDGRVTLRFAFLSPQVTEERVIEAIGIVASTMTVT
jgi:aromatic-L-amino-acid decarboxylase